MSGPHMSSNSRPTTTTSKEIEDPPTFFQEAFASAKELHKTRTLLLKTGAGDLRQVYHDQTTRCDRVAIGILKLMRALHVVLQNIPPLQNCTAILQVFEPIRREASLYIELRAPLYICERYEKQRADQKELERDIESWIFQAQTTNVHDWLVKFERQYDIVDMVL
ncbi:hypothetical protein EJ08DRAFT_665812 [Tothia fuscella]|uniref:Uncharacterized protein n=1 Tax=Tothia fuscella TaxID=1048955 RepID=A0A9P4NGC7_9PEZI|nr:hypothetical protein EJ08DRAFT_665812 [Tothia fuscella]